MPIVAVDVYKGPGLRDLPKNRRKPKGCGRGLQPADHIMSFRMYHILVLVCLLLEAHMSAADALQSTAATTLSNEAPIEVPCLPTIAIDPSSTPLAVMSQTASSSSSISHSTSAPDLSPSNNNNNNNDGQQGQSFHPQILPKMPKNFSWVVDGFLAALGFPNEPANMMYLVKHGIKYLISLTAELTPSIRGFEDKLVWSEIKIRDFAPPTLEQVDEFLRVVEKARSENTGVAVHCLMGKGRTGCMLACYFVKEWELPAEDALRYVRELRPGSVQTKALAIHCAHGKGRTGTMIACYLIKYHNQTATGALEQIREMRPGSVETFEQEELVYKFEEEYHKVARDQHSENQI